MLIVGVAGKLHRDGHDLARGRDPEVYGRWILILAIRLTRLTLANPFGKLVQVPARLHDRRLQPIVPLLRRDSHGAFGDPTLELAQGFVLVATAVV